MPNQSVIGQPGSLLGKIILGALPNQSPSFGFLTHVLDSNTLRVVFEVPVDESALNPGAYSLFPVTGIPEIFIPSAVSVEFFDGDMTSVAVKFSASLTLSAVYSLYLKGIYSLDGRISSTSTYNFMAVVPAPPRAVGAFLSSRSCLDVVFDKSVRDTSSSYATAQIFPILSDGTILSPSVLLPVVNVPDIPETNLRFTIQSDLSAGSRFLIQYQNATDSSFNTGDGEILLDLRLPSPSPWSYSDISTPTVIAAYINRVIPAENRVYSDIFFSCPMLSTDIVNVSGWSVTKEGVHLSGDSLPVTAPDPVDFPSLITICSDLKLKFNSHLSTPDIHLSDADLPPSIMSVIGLLNDLLEKFNSHSVTVPSHSYPDREDVVVLKPAFTIQQAVSLATALKYGFNAHLSALFGVIPYHLLTDTENAVISPDPIDSSDLTSASMIADELKTRLLMHELGDWHSQQDVINAPSAPYSRTECIFPSITTVSEAVSLLNELQSKYATHLITRPPHLYLDDVNAITPQTVTDPIVALSLSATMKGLFNNHILYEFPVEVDSVTPFADPDSSVPVRDGFTYAARLKLIGSASIPRYSITVNLRSIDFQNFLFVFTTSPFGTTDLISVLPFKNYLKVRTSTGLVMPRTEDVSITKMDGFPVRITNLSLESSLYSVQCLIEEMMNVFRMHLTEYGTPSSGPSILIHQNTDTANNFDNSNIPTMNEESVVVAVNFLKSVYNRHVSNTDVPYHVFQASANSVHELDATDFKSASNLANILNQALLDHRGNLSSHYGRGARLQFSKIFDILVIHYDGLMDGGEYVLTAGLKTFLNDPYSSPSSTFRNVNASFLGVSDPPFVAAASPEPGAGRGSPKNKLVRDQLNVFFSKPMREEPVLPSQFNFTGPSGLSVGGSYWEGSKFLRVQLSGVNDYSTYGFDVGLLTDVFGNPIQSYVPPPSPPEIPFVPNSAVVPVKIDIDFSDVTAPVQGQVGSGYSSVTYQDGRYAAFFLFELTDEHLVVVDVYGPSFGLMPFDSIINVLGLDRVVLASVSGLTNDISEQLAVVLNSGFYYIEVTTQTVGITGGVTVDVGTICNVATSPNSTFFGIVGVGCVSTTVPTNYANFVSFVASALNTTVTLNSSPGLTLVVHDGTNFGPILGTGGPSIPVMFATILGNVYVLEVHGPGPGPANYSLTLA